ncbi:MAG TPA: outer membrane beta-barrel protein [Terriglobales bacterium]|nr:outer membrane beta-barrel protein [Terriglobales bacterium]
MLKSALALLCMVVFAVPAAAQDCPPIEIFGEYSFLSIDTKGISSRQSANGWEAGVAMTLDKYLAVEFEGSGYYTSLTGSTGTSNVRDFYLLAGPRINLKPIFVRALFGGDHLSDNVFNGNVLAQGFAAAIGGGVDRRIKGRWSFRASADYVLSRHSVFSTSAMRQNNFRTSVGLAYTIGRDSSMY